MPHLTHPDPDRCYACPECNTTALWDRRATPGYKCHECGTETTDPIDREKNTTPDPYDNDGLPKNLSPEMRERVKELREGDS